jgi:hypothetical protein
MSIDDIVKSGIEVLKIGVWPVFLVWLIWFLRVEVRRIATRITELGPGGAKFAPPTAEQIPSPPPGGVEGGVPPGATPSSPAASGPAAAQEFIANVRSFISADQLDPAVQVVRADVPNRAGNDLAAQKEVLVYTVASLNIQLSHERNYNIVFGSQIQLLAQANTDMGVSQDVARETYELAKSRYPDFYSKSSFEQWIGFLENTGLIRKNENIYLLTPYGRGLLRYMLDRHLPTTKLY